MDDINAQLEDDTEMDTLPDDPAMADAATAEPGEPVIKRTRAKHPDATPDEQLAAVKAHAVTLRNKGWYVIDDWSDEQIAATYPTAKSEIGAIGEAWQSIKHLVKAAKQAAREARKAEAAEKSAAKALAKAAKLAADEAEEAAAVARVAEMVSKHSAMA